MIFKRSSKFRFFSIDSKSEDCVLQTVFNIPFFSIDSKIEDLVLQKVFKIPLFIITILKVETKVFKRCSKFRYLLIVPKSEDTVLQKVSRIPPSFVGNASYVPLLALFGCAR